MQQYKPYAATVELLPHLEGSPLLECLIGQKIIHVMERTGPYGSKPGKIQLIINPMTERVEHSDQQEKSFDSVALSHIRAQGLLLERSPKVLVVDVGVPMVVSLFEETPADIAQGDWVKFESLAPVHGFIVTQEVRGYHRRAEGDTDSL